MGCGNWWKARCTYYAVAHQRSLYKASEHVSGMVLMVWNTRQTGVEGHHQKRELDQWPQETSSTPRKPRLQVELEEETEGEKRERSLHIKIGLYFNVSRCFQYSTCRFEIRKPQAGRGSTAIAWLFLINNSLTQLYKQKRKQPTHTQIKQILHYTTNSFQNTKWAFFAKEACSTCTNFSNCSCVNVAS